MSGLSLATRIQVFVTGLIVGFGLGVIWALS